MFVEYKWRSYTEPGLSLTLVDTEFEETFTGRPVDDKLSVDVLTPIVEIYEKRNKSVPLNVVRYIQSRMGAPRDVNRVINAHPILHKYREDIEKLMLLV